jgi:uncharacterized protein (UPF0261 family)
MKKKVVLCIATIDTKGQEMDYIRKLIEKKGHNVLIMDVSCLESSSSRADISPEEVAQGADKKIEEVRSRKEDEAAEIMATGGAHIAKELYKAGKFYGVLGIGGGMGIYIASSIMKALPIGIPKVLVGSQKIVQAGLRGYVGPKDIVVIPSIADIAGLNVFTKKTLEDAANAIMGMLDTPKLAAPEKPVVFMSVMGTTAACADKIKSALENNGFEVIGFHGIGIGGMSLESLIEERFPVTGVVELALNEIGNELFGGRSSAGPNRLEAAGKKGIPQIIVTGNVDFIGFIGLQDIPPKFADHKYTLHNPQASAVRLNANELKMVAEVVANKLNNSKGPVSVVIPLRGFSAWDKEGKVFYDPEADKVFIETLKANLNPSIKIKEIDAHINDGEFADQVISECLELFKLRAGEAR